MPTLRRADSFADDKRSVLTSNTCRAEGRYQHVVQAYVDVCAQWRGHFQLGYLQDDESKARVSAVVML